VVPGAGIYGAGYAAGYEAGEGPDRDRIGAGYGDGYGPDMVFPPKPQNSGQLGHIINLRYSLYFLFTCGTQTCLVAQHLVPYTRHLTPDT
jgi:hypothetical protein